MTNSKIINQPVKEVKTKDLILEIAERLFSVSGYMGVSMRNIAEVLGISKPALYYHFKNKKELYLEVINRASEDLINSLEEVINQEVPLDNKFHNVITTYINYCFNKKNLVYLMLQKISSQDKKIIEHVQNASNKILDLLEPLIKETLKKSKKIKLVDSRFVTHLFIGIMNSFIINQSLLSNKKKYTSKEIADQLLILSLEK